MRAIEEPEKNVCLGRRLQAASVLRSLFGRENDLPPNSYPRRDVVSMYSVFPVAGRPATTSCGRDLNKPALSICPRPDWKKPSFERSKGGDHSIPVRPTSQPSGNCSKGEHVATSGVHRIQVSGSLGWFAETSRNSGGSSRAVAGCRGLLKLKIRRSELVSRLRHARV